jgi:hypothetical protein
MKVDDYIKKINKDLTQEEVDVKLKEVSKAIEAIYEDEEKAESQSIVKLSKYFENNNLVRLNY